MIYTKIITTPANTTENAPLETVLDLCIGIVHQVDIFFPPGAQGLHRLRVTRGVNAVIPTNAEGYIAGEDERISHKEYIDVDDEPKRLVVRSWNLDDTYEHTVMLRVGVLRKAIIAPWLITWQEKLGL